MKKMKVSDRITALLLSFAMIISCMPIPVFAMPEKLSEEALRVSDEFAEK